jgi:LacI family transcriptional regulator
MPSRTLRSRTVNLRQLAEHTGHSIAAVSSVLNGHWKKRRISETTVNRIQAAARQLGYVPNIFAKRLSAHAPGTSQALLAVITAFEAPLPLVSRAAVALHRAVDQTQFRSTRFTITIEMFTAGRLRQLPGLLANHRFSGAIIANSNEADDRFLASAKIQCPVVLINRQIAGYAAVLESPETGVTAANILVRAGCRHCAVLTPAAGTSITADRATNFRRTIAAATGTTAGEIICGGRNESDGYKGMRAYLERHPKVDGIFAINDTLAIGAYLAINESGREIPGDLRVVGVGDHTASPYLLPPLTCVGSSEEKLHQEAADLLLELFTGAEAGAPQRTMPLQIVQRASTGQQRAKTH